MKALRWLGGALVAVSALVSQRAQAQEVDEFGPLERAAEPEARRSAQTMAVEIRFGPYRPGIDSQLAGAAKPPYETVFGNKTRYQIGLEVDFQLLRIPHLGSLGPGVGISYTTASAKARIAQGSPNQGELSGEDTSLSIFPVYAVGVFRVDVLARETAIPLSFYAKAGLSYALWWAGSGNNLGRTDGVVGEGASYGYHAALGGMLLLNVLDQRAAIDMDNSVGINATHLFFEVFRSDLSGFGSGRMQVGSTTWVTGLAFEF